ncbi:MAG: hypothetical protein ABJD24_13005 [Acidimicrobiales bacterium]
MRARIAALGLVAVATACGSSTATTATTPPPETTSTSAQETTTTADTTATTEPTTTSSTQATTTLPDQPTGYAPATLPAFPAVSAPPPAPVGTMADGVYFGVVVAATPGGTGPASIAVEFHGFFSGPAGEAAAKEDGQEFTNDYYVRENPNSTRTIDLTRKALVTVTNSSDPGSVYAVGGDEFVRLWLASKDPASAGPAPSSMPSGFMYAPFGVWVTVKDGNIASVDQFWAP